MTSSATMRTGALTRGQQPSEGFEQGWGGAEIASELHFKDLHEERAWRMDCGDEWGQRAVLLS